METGKFYFIKDDYYQKFPNCGLLGNKDEGARPCFYCFEYDGYYWMVPISSQLPKYKAIYSAKIKRYGKHYDGIRFGFVNGQERAFLIQNVCPVTNIYIDKIYRIYHDTVDVTIDAGLASELNSLIRKVIRYYKKGIRITLSDLSTILTSLEREKN